MFRSTFAIMAFLAISNAGLAADASRLTVWDIKIGEAVTAQPSPDAFQNFACGSNGGPPRQKLAGWADYRSCPPEASGLHEVYFEYDDENEYIARAHDLEREITRWTGTTDTGFPIITSVLVDESGIVQGVRLVTDPRPSFRNDIFEPDLRPRTSAYQFGGIMAAKYNVEPSRDCISSPLQEGESAIAGNAIKRSCERVDVETQRRYVVKISYFRKVGQSGYDPRVPGRTTQGAFESSSRLERFFAPGR